MPKTNNNANYLAQLQDYYAQHRGFPAYARLGEVLGLAAKSAVKKVLERLQGQGFLNRTPDEVWVPTRQFFERPLADFRVPAGSPVTANDVGAQLFVVDEYLVAKPSRTTFVSVKGDSMIDAGIHDGDVAVVEKRPRAKSGDIVVAIVDGELTLKTLDKENGEYILRPANSAYPIIRPRGNLEMYGVVVGMIRKYRG